MCVLVWALPVYPATPGWGVRRGCVCLGSGVRCAPPLLAGVLGCVCAGVRAPPVSRHSWLGCAVWVCVCGIGFRLRPATPGCGVGVCVCWCGRSPCTPPLLAGVCGVGVCVWARVWAAPRLSWLGCRGVRVGVHSPPVPRHSWLGCAAWVCVLGFRFRLRPATPDWGVGVRVCWCARSACTPPLLAGVCSVGVCVWARVSAAPRHSWLGCLGVCVLVCPFRSYPATPGWGVRRGCVCLGLGFGCAPPLLAGVLGCVCAGVRAPLAPRHSWLGCAVWVCVFGLGFRLRPATPGWGVGVCVLVCVLPLYPATPGWGVRRGCVCFGSGLGCAPPLLARVLGCVCAGVDAPLVPRHSWLGCAVWVCVCGSGFRLRPATPGWGAGVCVCWCGRSPCTSPLLAGVCGVGVCVWAQVSAAPRHSWLGCGGVRVGLRAPPVPRHSCLGCAAWVCVLGFAFRLRPATPGWGVGVRVCWCARSACTPPLLAGVCGLGVCVWARVSAAPRHSWLGCWSVCVLVCLFRSYPATPGWAVRRGCVCLGSGFGCAPPLLAGVLGCVCAGVRAPLAPRHSWLGCAVWVCVFGLGFRLRPATPGWGVGVCVLVCVLPLYPATPGWGVRRGCVCFGSGLGCAPPLLARVLGCVCAGVDAPLVPRHSWLGCAVWVCVCGSGFRLRPATPGWGAGVCVCVVWALPLYLATPGWGVRRGCVCLGSGFGCAPPLLAGVLGCACWFACSPCTPPLLPGVCGVGVCAWVRVSAAPRHSWLGCWGACVLVCALRLHPATPGWGVRSGCVCLGSGFGCAPPLLAGVLECVCACVPVPLVPHHSWLGRAAWLCVLGLGFWLRPATPGCGVRCGCVCLGSGFGCAPPLLAGVLGCLCAGVRALPVPRHSWLGGALWVCVLGLRPATPGWGVWCVGWLLPGTCSCAVVRCVLCALHGFAAPGGRCCLAPVLVPWLWPAACLSGVPCGPALVRRASSGPVALGAPVGFPVAVVPFPSPGACAPGFTGWLRGARGGRPRTGLIVPAAGPRRGRGAGLAPRRTRSGPRDGFVPGGSLRRQSWAACAAVVGVCGPGH